MSNSGGRANFGNSAATLAPGETTQTCSSSSCHGNNSFDPVMNFTIIDENGAEVTSYEFDKTYTVNINISANLGTPIGYGFQAVSLDGLDNNYNAWGTEFSPGTQISELSNGREYWEHLALLPDNTFEIDWVSPSSDLGDITFYGAAIAANANGNRSGDGGTNTTFTLEGPTVSDVEEIEDRFNVTILSSATSNGQLTYQSNSSIDRISILNTRGGLIHTYVNPPTSVDISMLSSGLYIVNFQTSGSHVSSKIIVQ
jgi:hypothetical protein